MNHIYFSFNNVLIIYDLFLKCKSFLKIFVKSLKIISFGWGGRFRTLECGSQSPMPYHLATPQRRGFYLAGVAGFEPTNDRVKVYCLTAWLHPNGFLKIYGVEGGSRTHDLKIHNLAL